MDDLPLIDLADALIQSRQHLGPKHLAAPGPDEATLRTLFTAAAAAPDHGQLTPWRFLVLGTEARQRLSEVFAASLLDRDPQALPDQVEDARQKAFRGPVLILAVVNLAPREAGERAIPTPERLLSLGCAVQNLLLAAQARGWGSGLSSGQALQSPQLRQAFHLSDDEQAVCFISLGTPRRSKPVRQRPGVDAFVRWV